MPVLPIDCLRHLNTKVQEAKTAYRKHNIHIPVKCKEMLNDGVVGSMSEIARSEVLPPERDSCQDLN